MIKVKCSGWKDEGNNQNRSDSDDFTNVKYGAVQFYLTEDKEINTTATPNEYEVTGR